ncbi:hypothetical protein [Alicyclobacillus fastidiosus]|uniref:Uncharacterized protein n=1 Tax=Alicyclobacillus fastidiosus TaxID=392011 RepID=A0ABV5A9W6_9BACL|nr:hypothetical protein [Alicyclobacillus fastidiosus]WEH10975.1 hypothetical protein PYS47_07095 [Alicyclobacillus fastidiosus]
MEQQPEGVVITLRDVYDVSQKTHEAVKDLGPRVSNVENTAGDAMTLARAADERSRNNERFIKGLRNIGGTVLGGTVLAIIGKWATTHIH